MSPLSARAVAPVAKDPRPRCPRCRQAQEGCWCPHLEVQQPAARIVLLQHPREARNPLGTARMAHLSLPGSELLTGIDFQDVPRFQELMTRERDQLVVLYPTADARPAEELATRPGPPTIVVIDGTWWQAKKIWRTNPCLHALPTYRLNPERPSRYVIRSEPAAHCLSTIEAIAGVLEAVAAEPGRHAGMLRALEALVDKQLAHAGSEERSPRRRLRTRSPSAPSLPAMLEGRVRQALLVHAEGNGWPASMDPRPPTELVQWVAMRPATGEQFGALVAPSVGWSPTAASNLRLSDADRRSVIPLEEFRRRWEAFVRPADVWCAWGHTPLRLLAEVGVAPSPAVDVRAWSHHRLRARPGTLEEAHQLVEGDAVSPVFCGRGGARLACLGEVFRKLVEGCG